MRTYAPLAAQTRALSNWKKIQLRIESVGACLTTPVVEKDDLHVCQTLQERMATDHVPGVSIAVIHNREIEWAQGFGLLNWVGRR